MRAEYENVVGRWPSVAGRELPRLSAVDSWEVGVMAQVSSSIRSLKPKSRPVLMGLSVLVCAVLAWAALTADEALPRVLFGAFSTVLLGLVLFIFQQESVLANSHLLVSGEALSCRHTRRSVEVRYSCMALDGHKYEKTSHLGKWREFQEGRPLQGLFHPLRPDVSKPLNSFIFYRFDTETP